MLIFTGLGNPGREYDGTRHNTGFDCIDYLAALHRIPIKKVKFKSLLGEGMIGSEKVLLVKPQTFMNNSGEAVRDVLDYYGLEPNKLIVIYDDIDLNTGVIRIRTKGSAGTHNGMKSILYHLETENFPRIRVGIGKPAPDRELVSYVLGRFTPEERSIINGAVERVAAACEEIVAAGIESAMGKYNGGP